MPVRPTRQNSRKRAETASLVSFDVTSAAKSSAILRVELALAMLALAEHERQLDDAQAAARRRHDVEQDLEALRGELRRERLEARRAGS